MTPDHSLLLAYYASDGADCAREHPALSPETARMAAQIALLTGEERRLLAVSEETREAALELGQRRFERWERENPAKVASYRDAVARSDVGEAPGTAHAMHAHDALGEPIRPS